MSITVVKQQWDRAEAIWGRDEANKLFGNRLNANTDGRVGAVGASVGGVVDRECRRLVDYSMTLGI